MAKTSLSSKERVLTAFHHQNPDRVPIDYLTNPGIDRRLKDHFGIAAEDDEGLLQTLGVDFRVVNAPYAGPQLYPQPPGIQTNPWGAPRRWIEHETGGYWDYIDFPLQHANLEEIEAWPMPSPDDYDYSQIEVACDRFNQFFVVAGGPGFGDVINSTSMIRNMETTLIDLMNDDEACLRWIDRRLEIQLEITRRTIDAAKRKVDMLWMGEDLGTQRGPLISPRLFRKHIRPRLQQYVDLAKSNHLLVMLHSCGSSSWAFEDFIDMGIDVVDTLQPEVKDMQPAYLKATFGKRLAFHGCISTAGAVTYGTPDETIADVRSVLETMMPGGGYALAPTHQLQDNSRVENVVALYQAAREYGSY
jgi:uroporphyrinogen decarboxylase